MRRRRSKLLVFGDVKPLKSSSAGPKTYLAAPQNNLPKVVNTTFPSPHHFSKELKSGIYHLFTGEWKALSAMDPVGIVFALRPRWRPLRASVAGSLLAARPWPAVHESRLLGVLRRPAPGFRPRRLLSGALVTRCSPLSFKRRPDTTPLVGRHDQAGRHLS